MKIRSGFFNVLLSACFILLITSCQKEPLLEGPQKAMGGPIFSITVDLLVLEKNSGKNKFDSENAKSWSFNNVAFEYLSYSDKDFENSPGNTIGPINYPYITNHSLGNVLRVYPIIGNVGIKKESLVKVKWPDGTEDIIKIINENFNESIFVTEAYLNDSLAWHYLHSEDGIVNFGSQMIKIYK